MASPKSPILPTPLLRRQPTSPCRPLFLILVLMVAVYTYLLSSSSSSSYGGADTYQPSPGVYGTETSERHQRSSFEDLTLGEVECRSKFPGLMNEIDRAAANGKFRIERAKGARKSSLIAKVEGRSIWILDEPGGLSRQMREACSTPLSIPLSPS